MLIGNTRDEGMQKFLRIHFLICLRVYHADNFMTSPVEPVPEVANALPKQASKADNNRSHNE